MKISNIYIKGAAVFGLALGMTLTSCNSFLEDQVPQGTLTEKEVKDPKNIDNLIVSAYAGLVSIEDMNASFSLWNYDTRSDDAYVGGNGFSDGAEFHRLELEQGVQTSDWPFTSIWNRYYQYLSRVNLSLDVLGNTDQSVEIYKQRTAEMKFLRAYGLFQLKRLFKNIPFVNKPNMTEEDYKNMTNTEYNNDEAWQQIINDLEEAFNVLPVKQTEKGRPTKAAAAAFLAKVYLYKAYRQDDPSSNRITSINKDDLQKVIDYTEEGIFKAANHDLEKDAHNNFRPEEQYENGVESVWAIQYSKNDGTKWGNLNFSNRLIVPCIPNVHGSGCDFYKPSKNLVNAYQTDVDGMPLKNTAKLNYKVGSAQNVDPRLFITVGVPGTPYMFNPGFMIEESDVWSRAGGGMYGYFVSLKQNVDPALTGKYLFLCDDQWASSMNRIVFRYADVLLMRAEAYAQMGGHEKETLVLLNKIRQRAMDMETSSVVATYPAKYGVHFAVGIYDQDEKPGVDELMRRVKIERRLELAMESERFFDLVRWGEAAEVINAFYGDEEMKFLDGAHFEANRNEYLPIPHEQMAASAGKYKQNVGW